MYKKQSLIILFSIIFQITAISKDYYVSDFGAKADGHSLNTVSIQAAIDFAASNGGGKVVFTPGRWVSGTIYLKSGVVLYLESGATLLGARNPMDYKTDPYCEWTSFIFAIKQDNIGISGFGTIDCRGYEVVNNLIPFKHFICEGVMANDRPDEKLRPQNVHFQECSNITVRDVTLKNPASWTQHYEKCRGVLIENEKVYSTAYWNNDGLDIVDCSDVIIRGCFIDSSDDAYCFKSHSVDGVCENIVIENCVGRSSASGIKIGTKTLGSFRNIQIKNVTIFDTYRSAINISCVDGGNVDNIVVDGLRGIHIGNPLFIRTGARLSNGNSSSLKNIVIKNMICEVSFEKADAGYDFEGPEEHQPRNVCPCIIAGIPGSIIENVSIINSVFTFPGNADKFYAYAGTTPEELSNIPEKEYSYPEYSMWRELPSWGGYVRHVCGFSLENVTIQLMDKDYRPALVLDDVNSFVADRLNILDPQNDKNQIIKHDVK